MSKAKTERALATNEAKAKASSIRIGLRKLNLVAGMIRGRKVGDAINQLLFCEKRIAKDVKKCLDSAIANAENNHNLDVDSLIVKEAYVSKNLVMKRFHTRGRGRSASILKPFSNLTIIVSEKGESL